VQALTDALPGDRSLPSNGGWYIKQLWRAPFPKETLYYAAASSDPVADTNLGYFDKNNRRQAVGANFRHKRLCLPRKDCTADFLVYRWVCVSVYVWRLCIPRNEHTAARIPGQPGIPGDAVCGVYMLSPRHTGGLRDVGGRFSGRMLHPRFVWSSGTNCAHHLLPWRGLHRP
jgi:hypothetical protein